MENRVTKIANKTYTTLYSTTVYEYTLTLEQAGHDDFAVRYGMQRKENLPYAMAAKEFGECLMHRLVCEGLLGTEED